VLTAVFLNLSTPTHRYGDPDSRIRWTSSLSNPATSPLSKVSPQINGQKFSIHSISLYTTNREPLPKNPPISYFVLLNENSNFCCRGLHRRSFHSSHSPSPRHRRLHHLIWGLLHFSDQTSGSNRKFKGVRFKRDLFDRDKRR